MTLIRVGIECESIEENETWGVGRIVKKLLEEISRRPELQKEFKFFLYFKSKIPDLPYLANPIFVKKVVGVPSFSLYYYLFLPIKLWFEKLDLVFFPNYMLPIIFGGKSLVVLTEDVYYEFKEGMLPLRYKLAYRVFASWAAKHATKIMAISESSKKEITRLFKINPDRVVVNQLGADRPRLQIPNPKSQLPNSKNKIGGWELGIGNYVLYVGQAFPRRHLKETILAFEKIAPKFPDLRLVAIGKDKYNPPTIEKLKNKINRRLERDAIIYKEYVPEGELAELYFNAKCLIYISSREAFGLPPLEALAHGAVPVVADQPITREIFGKDAFFVTNPDDPNSIASVLAEALINQSKREEIITSAAQILKKYTWEKHANRFLEIVRETEKTKPNNANI